MARSTPRAVARSITGVALAATLTGGMLVAHEVTAPRAHALDLPTWSDVEAAKRDEAAAAKKVQEIKALLVKTKAEVAQRQKESEDAAQAADRAESEFQKADQKSRVLEKQAADSKKVADETADRAAALVSQMYRSGGVDRNLELFLDPNPKSADKLLDRMAMMSKSTERNTKASDEAKQAMNSAHSLGQQAEQAKKERERLYSEARNKSLQAAKVADEARGRQSQAEENQKVLETQLAALQDKTTKTTAGYQQRLRIEEEQRRKAEEEARRRAEEAARRNPPPSGGGAAPAPRPPGGGAPPSSGAWGLPLPRGSYFISCGFGCYAGHIGTDLAAGMGTPIYAAGSGRVTWSGWRGGWGNMVEIDHGGGIVTRYAHMVRAPSVGFGQWVGRGQLIGYVGTTGNSTGPHLHVEALVWGTPNNPAVFFANRGVYF